jgi:cell division protein FtsQ
MGARRPDSPVPRPRRARPAPAATARRLVIDVDAVLGRLRYLGRRWGAPLWRLKTPRGIGIASAALLVVAALGYGVVKGDHIPTILGALRDARDATANAAGFAIQSVGVTGRKQLGEKDILAAAGITARTSLLFLDVEAARAQLKTNPWIADAEVRKLYPGRLLITIEEREAFALWQKDGRISVIATDGAVLAPFTGERRFAGLPLVVGQGAEKQGKAFLAALAGYPAIRDQVRAGILIAERRWNLRLKNGIDVRLPETDIAKALETLAGLDRDKKLLSRDITAIDLRLPDRVSVRLSDGIAQAREDALKKAKKKNKGNDA